MLRGLDLVVHPGESVGIAGPNGSGKTTLVRTAATLLSVDSGTVTVLGTDSAHQDLIATRRAIGLVGHQPALIPELTLEENLTHIARLSPESTPGASGGLSQSSGSPRQPTGGPTPAPSACAVGRR